jgi:hypothetical protein
VSWAPLRLDESTSQKTTTFQEEPTQMTANDERKGPIQSAARSPASSNMRLTSKNSKTPVRVSGTRHRSTHTVSILVKLPKACLQLRNAGLCEIRELRAREPTFKRAHNRICYERVQICWAEDLALTRICSSLESIVIGTDILAYDIYLAHKRG